MIAKCLKAPEAGAAHALQGKGWSMCWPDQCSSVPGWVGAVISELSLLLQHLNSRITSNICTVAREGIFTLFPVLSTLTRAFIYQPHKPYTTIYNQGNFSVKALWATEQWFFFSPSSFLFLFRFLFLRTGARFISLGEFFKAGTVGLILLLLKPLGVLPTLLTRTELGQCRQLWSPRFVCTHVKVGNRGQIKWEPV